MEDEAQLVSRIHRGQDDPAGRPACDVETCRLNRGRGQRQPLRVCVAATGCRFSHRDGSKGRGSSGSIGSEDLRMEAITRLAFDTILASRSSLYIRTDRIADPVYRPPKYTPL